MSGVKKLVVATGVLIWLCIAMPTLAASSVSQETLDAVKEEAADRQLTAWMGDIYKALSVEVDAGDVFEQDGRFCVYMTVNADLGQAAESPWDTHYMAGMCACINVDAKEAGLLSKEDWTALFAEKGYTEDAAVRLADGVLYVARQKDWQLQQHSVFSFSVYAEFSLTDDGTYYDLEVYQDTDFPGEERLQPLGYGAVNGQELYDKGYQRMERMIRIAAESETDQETESKETALRLEETGTLSKEENRDLPQETETAEQETETAENETSKGKNIGIALIIGTALTAGVISLFYCCRNVRN